MKPYIFLLTFIIPFIKISGSFATEEGLTIYSENLSSRKREYEPSLTSEQFIKSSTLPFKKRKKIYKEPYEEHITLSLAQQIYNVQHSSPSLFDLLISLNEKLKKESSEYISQEAEKIPNFFDEKEIKDFLESFNLIPQLAKVYKFFKESMLIHTTPATAYDSLKKRHKFSKYKIFREKLSDNPTTEEIIKPILDSILNDQNSLNLFIEVILEDNRFTKSLLSKFEDIKILLEKITESSSDLSFQNQVDSLRPYKELLITQKNLPQKPLRASNPLKQVQLILPPRIQQFPLPSMPFLPLSSLPSSFACFLGEFPQHVPPRKDPIQYISPTYTHLFGKFPRHDALQKAPISYIRSIPTYFLAKFPQHASARKDPIKYIRLSHS